VDDADGVRPPLTVDLTGDRIYGDDFASDEIEAWFADEAEAYVDMTGDGVAEFGYGQWAFRYGYRWLPKKRWQHVVGFGAGVGGELVPVASAADGITIVESSTKYRAHKNLGEVNFVRAQPGGDILLPDASVDLLTCFGVLHHVPNVSHVVGEFGRIVRPGGYLLLREPITSMGDWTKPRPGLTTHERGIRLDVLEAKVRAAGFAIERRTLLGFSPIRVACSHWTAPYNSSFWTLTDRAICELLRWNLRYNATHFWRKLRPTAAHLVAVRTA
jgi:SAM-dependent methyltransferase